MIWKEIKIIELQKEIQNHKGYGESKRFYQLREEIIAKLGKKEWEKILRKTKNIGARVNIQK